MISKLCLNKKKALRLSGFIQACFERERESDSLLKNLFHGNLPLVSWNTNAKLKLFGSHRCQDTPSVFSTIS